MNTKKILFLSITALFFLHLQSQEIGLQLYSVRNQIKNETSATLDQVRSMGIKELEGGELYGMDVHAYKKMLDQKGFRMVSIGAEYDELKKDLTPLIQKAKALGATYVVCFWIPHEGNAFGIKDVEASAALFNKAGKTLKENGLKLCYHPHGFEFRPYGKGTLFDEMIRMTDPAYANFELDVYWAKQGCGDPVKLLKKYPNRFFLMHLKDRAVGTTCNDTGHADEETNVVLGDGDVNIKAVMKAAKRSAVKHYFIEDESTRVMKQIPLSMAFLQSIR